MSQAQTQEQWVETIKSDIADHKVFIYAKGEKNAAMCGFSHRVMEVFNQLGVEYNVRNILSDPMIRPSLVSVSEWPTTPQIFIDGKFVGGCDIVLEMFQNGDLHKLLGLETPAG